MPLAGTVKSAVSLRYPLLLTAGYGRRRLKKTYHPELDCSNKYVIIYL